MTIPPSKIRDFCHLPLHKGGFGGTGNPSPTRGDDGKKKTGDFWGGAKSVDAVRLFGILKK